MAEMISVKVAKAVPSSAGISGEVEHSVGCHLGYPVEVYHQQCVASGATPVGIADTSESVHGGVQEVVVLM